MVPTAWNGKTPSQGNPKPVALFAAAVARNSVSSSGDTRHHVGNPWNNRAKSALYSGAKDILYPELSRLSQTP